MTGVYLHKTQECAYVRLHTYTQMHTYRHICLCTHAQRHTHINPKTCVHVRYVAEVDLGLLIPLPLSPEDCDYTHELSHSLLFRLETGSVSPSSPA